MDDLEKEKLQIQRESDKLKKELEKELSSKYEHLLHSKDNEIDRLTSDLKKA